MLFDGPVPSHIQSAQQNELDVSGELNASRAQTVLRLPSGRTVVLPTELLLGEGTQRSAVAESGAPVQPEVSAAGSSAGVAESAGQREQVIPLVAEQAQVGKETITTGTVRIHRSTEQFSQTVGLPLTRITWDVERVPIGQVYQERPDIRQEGDVTVYPVVEERLVARREYFVVEEVRLRRESVTTERTATLQLKRDVLVEERVPGDAVTSS